MADRFVQAGFVNLDDRQGATTSSASVSRRVVPISLEHKIHGIIAQSGF
jgi:hypothetical protein